MEKTTEQKATNHDTMKHIRQVQRLLMNCIHELQERLITHDNSKLEEPELSTFVKYTPLLKDSTYGSDEYKQFLTEMKPALDHHYAHNPHHPEFFKNGIEDMDLIDLMEMICDWKAATMRHDNGDIHRSIEINKERFGISDQLAQILENSVENFFE